MTSIPVEQATSRFVPGSRYALTFVGDSDSHVVYEVVSRTSKTVTITDGSKAITRKVTATTWDDAEQCLPFGRYSMSPSLRAVERTLPGGVRANELPVGSYFSGSRR